MRGMNNQSGTAVQGLAHLKQSIRDILSTPVGTRVMRRDYGSRLFEFVDAPGDRGTLLQLYAATAAALARWEPRFRLSRMQADMSEPGRIGMTLEGEYLPEGQPITLQGIIL